MKRLRVHLAALFCAGFVLAALTALLPSFSGHLVLPYDRTLAHLDQLGQNRPFTAGYQYLADRLRTGDAVVMFASSELINNPTPYVAHALLPNRLGIPLMSLGRGYFQSFSHYLLLSALRSRLNPKSRLVILFSPGWIETDRVPVSFLDYYLRDDLVYDIRRQNGDLTALADYLRSRAPELTHLSPALREVMWAYPSGPVSRSRRLLGVGAGLLLQAQAWCYPWAAAFTRLSLWTQDDAQPAAPASTVDWAALERQAAADEARRMTNNTLWVHNGYFSQFLSAYPHGGARLFKNSLHTETELLFLRRELELLRGRGARVLLVILPLNGRVYGDLDRFQPVRPRIHALAAALQVPVYDMWDQTPEIGLMGDGMHIGSLGWVRIDHEITRWLQ